MPAWHVYGPAMANYWVRGDDNEEYGPVTKDELRDWIAEDRVGIDTEIRTGGTEDWQPIQHYPELVVLIAEAEVKRGSIDGPGAPLANLANRGMSFVVDFLIVSILSFVLGSIVWNLFGMDPMKIHEEMMEYLRTGEGHPPLGYTIMQLIVLAVIIPYFTYFIGRDGQTPAMKVFRLRIVDDAGLTVSYWRAAIRAMAMYFSINALFIGFAIALIMPKKQTLHDLVARTYVVALPPLPKPPESG